jgi:SSS family solute:Na+ symporter
MDALTLLILLIYLFAVAYLGYRGYRATKTAADYLVAGRNINPIVMALSYGATFISTSAIVGFGGVAANLGMGLLWLTFLNIFVGIYIAFVFLGNPTRRMGHHLDAHTFPELLGKRFQSRALQVIGGLIIFLFMPLYAMAVIIGGAEFIGPIFHIPFNAALYIFAFIVAAYVVAGGMKGVMFTDALQATIMLIGMVILLAVTYATLGGFTQAHQSLTEMAPRVPAALKAIGHRGWTAMPLFGWAKPGSSGPEAIPFNLWWTMVTTIILGVGIGVLAQPQLVVRFMTVSSRQSLNRAVVAGGIFILFMTGVAFVVGPLSNVYFARHETIRCRLVDDQALLDPGPDGKGRLTLLPPDALAEVMSRAKRFIAYRLPGDAEDQALRYVLWTPEMTLTRGTDGRLDEIRPGLIAIARTATLGTPLSGNADAIIPHYVASAFPKWFGIVFLLTLLAAAMSTLSSQFHAMGTAIGRDVFETLTGERHSTRSIAITRLGILAGLAAAILLGKMVRFNIIALATAIFFGLCGASFLPAFLGALFWKRMTRAGTLASLLVGFLASAFWSLFINSKTATGLGLCKALFGKETLIPASFSPTWAFVDPLVVALPLSLLTAILVSLGTRPLSDDHVNWCFGGPKPR